MSQRVVKCDLCDYATETNANLRKHMLKHVGTKSFQCSVCPYKSNYKSDLKRHMKKHEDDDAIPPIRCDFVGWGVAQCRIDPIEYFAKYRDPSVSEGPVTKGL